MKISWKKFLEWLIYYNMKKLQKFLFLYFWFFIPSISYSVPLLDGIRSMALWLIVILVVPILLIIVFLIKGGVEKKKNGG